MTGNEIDDTDHIVTFDETAYRSVSLYPTEEEQVPSADEIETEEYKTLESAECSCGEYFDSHEDAVEHLRSLQTDTG